jgi:hypothetical protein
MSSSAEAAYRLIENKLVAHCDNYDRWNDRFDAAASDVHNRVAAALARKDFAVAVTDLRNWFDQCRLLQVRLLSACYTTSN